MRVRGRAGGFVDQAIAGGVAGFDGGNVDRKFCRTIGLADGLILELFLVAEEFVIGSEGFQISLAQQGAGFLHAGAGGPIGLRAALRGLGALILRADAGGVGQGDHADADHQPQHQQQHRAAARREGRYGLH